VSRNAFKALPLCKVLMSNRKPKMLNLVGVPPALASAHRVLIPILLVVRVFGACTGSSPTWTSTADSSSVGTCISNASSGDLINVSGTATWSASVTIPNSKNLILSGGGNATITNVSITINSAATGAGSRVTGFIFNGNYSTNPAITTNGCGGLASCGGTVTVPYRIDNNTFNDTPDSVNFISVSGNGPGLIDHNTFNGGGASEMIHNMGVDATGWTSNATPGSPYMVYIETNTFSYPASGSPAYAYGTMAIESYYGSQNVFRYNTLNMCGLDQHGTPGNVWARWWEIYDNTFTTNVANANEGTYITLRGGSGVVFGNSHSGTDGASCCGIDIWVECVNPGQQCTSGATYPQLYQVGRGISESLSPAYLWANTDPQQSGGAMLVSSESPLAQLNRDYYSSVTQPSSLKRWELTTDTSSTTYSYTPFTYPYPLTSAGLPNPAGTADAQPPTTPTNLAATAVSSSQINLTWTASTDNVGVTGYKVYRNASQVGTSATNSYSDTGLTASTSYSYTVSAYDAAGNNSSQCASASATTQAGVVDTQPPTVPTSLSATAVSSSQINLSWTASTDNVGVTGYKIYRNAAQVGTSVTNSYSDTGLVASTTYSYTVSAYDAAGNNSAQSTSASATTQAQATAAFIPSTRTIDWTHAGIPGGIPSASWPIYATLSPSGGADDSVAIQTAINNAPAGSVIFLNPGTYTLHRSSIVCYGKSDDYATGVYEAGLCLTDKSVVLRGSGPNQTVLQYGDGAGIISMGQTYLSSSSVVFIPVTSTASKGATQLTLQNTTGITVNSYVVVTQTNPTDPADGNPLVDTTGYTGACSYCGHDLPNTVMTQIDKVTAISGNLITLERPLYFNYTNSPQVYHLPMIENVGLESLRVIGTAESGTALEYKNINLEACAHCWVHDVESDWAVDKSNIYLSDVYASEISNNYLYEAFNHDSGADYSLLLEFRNSENLIQNNIIRRARHSTPQSGSSGNVYAYNYELDAYMGEYPNSLPETEGHAAHPFMNLWEGNVTPNWEFDFAHGSSSHNTMFRNYIDMTSTNPNTGNPMTGALIAINVAYYSNYENVVGNVLGAYGSTCRATAYETDADAAEVNGVIYQLGYWDDGGDPSPNLTLSAKVGQTILRGGNWDCVTNSTVWSSNVPSGSLASSYLGQQTLPISLFLSAEPSWFTLSGATWPPIDPAATTKVTPLPAQLCYNSGPKVGAAFNPAACYEGANTQAPAAPTGLSVTVH